MNEIIKINEIISSNYATIPEAGDKVYTKLKKMIDKIPEDNSSIILDFSQIVNITSAFLNNALGKLFSEYSAERLISLLRFSGVKTEDDFNIIKLSINNAIMMAKYNK